MPLTLTQLIPLHEEKRATLATEEAAAHLGLADQTLRTWACYGSGPIKKLALILGVAPHDA